MLVLNRSLVEHINHFIKDRCRALAGQWKRDLLRQPELFEAACLILNRLRRLRLEFQTERLCQGHLDPHHSDLEAPSRTNQGI